MYRRRGDKERNSPPQSLVRNWHGWKVGQDRGGILELSWLLAAGTCQVWKGSSSQAGTVPSTNKPGSESSWVLASCSTCFEQTKTHSSDGGQQPVLCQGVWAQSFPTPFPLSQLFSSGPFTQQGRSWKHPGESEF